MTLHPGVRDQAAHSLPSLDPVSSACTLSVCRSNSGRDIATKSSQCGGGVRPYRGKERGLLAWSNCRPYAYSICTIATQSSEGHTRLLRTICRSHRRTSVQLRNPSDPSTRGWQGSERSKPTELTTGPRWSAGCGPVRARRAVPPARAVSVVSSSRSSACGRSGAKLPGLGQRGEGGCVHTLLARAVGCVLAGAGHGAP